DPDLDPGVRVDRHPVVGPALAAAADAARPGLLRGVRARRDDRGDAGLRAVRLAGPRHPLRGRAPALRADRRADVPAVRGAVLLAAAGQRADAVGAPGPHRVLAGGRRLPPDLRADAPHRAAGDAAARVH